MSHGPTFHTDWTPLIITILSFVILFLLAPSIPSVDVWLSILIFLVIYVGLFLLLFGFSKLIRRRRRHYYRPRKGNHYLIEFRFFGKAKADMKSLIWEINRRFHIRPRYRPVPHVSLVGPFIAKNEGRLINDFRRICEKQNLMRFQVVGFNTFEENRVVYIEVQPDNEMDDFRWQLSQTLQPYCNLKPYDFDRDFKFHGTIAMKLSPMKFNQVKNYINNKTKPRYKNVLLRVTLIKNRRILYEYDFLLKKMLNRWEAKDGTILSRTFNELKKIID
jgi:2'-5' RNA ligase